MNLRNHAFNFGVVLATITGAAQAKDRAMPAEAQAKTAMPVQMQPAESIAVSVLNGRNVVWAGTLRVGGSYGSASFSQSKSEFAEPCQSEARPDGNQNSSSQNLSFNLNRYNMPQQPDRFNVSLNWSQPASTCQGEGNDSFGFNRMVTLPKGQSVTVEGSGGMSVKLTRGR